MFRSDKLFYLGLRVSPMHLRPYKHPYPTIQGDWLFVERQAELTLETQLQVHQQRSGQKIWYLTLLWEFRQHICNLTTNIRRAATKEGDDLWNGVPNRFSKLDYE